VVVLVAPIVALMVYYWLRSGLPAEFRWSVTVSELLYGVDVVMSIGTLIWLGFWFGLKARSQAGAIFQAVLLAKGAPYVIGLLFSSSTRIVLAASGQTSVGTWILWSAPPLTNLCLYLWLIRWSRRCLRIELEHDGPAPLTLFQAIASLTSKARRWPRSPDP
jgi:hypothetical protein